MNSKAITAIIMKLLRIPEIFLEYNRLVEFLKKSAL